MLQILVHTGLSGHPTGRDGDKTLLSLQKGLKSKVPFCRPKFYCDQRYPGTDCPEGGSRFNCRNA